MTADAGAEAQEPTLLDRLRPPDGAGEVLDRLRQFARLTPAIDIDGPRVRLGLAYAAATAVLLVDGGVLLGVWLALVAMAAAGQSARSWKRAGEQPLRVVAVLGAPLLPMATAVAGTVGLAVAAVIVGVAAVALPNVSSLQPRPGPPLSPVLTALIPLICGLAPAALIVTRERGLVAAVVLFGLVSAHDAATFVIGSGARRRWEGVAGGVAAVAAVVLLVAAVLVPPFRGPSPWLLGLLAIVLLPVGTMVASLLLGDREAPVPALRRLDSLLLLAPLWAVLTPLLLDQPG